MGSTSEFDENKLRVVLVERRHPDFPARTHWTIGNSAIEAQLIVDLLPEKHVLRKSKKDDSGVVLADITFVSNAAYHALFAWSLSGGDVGPVKLVPAEHPHDERNVTGKDLMAKLLAGKPVIFESKCILLENEYGIVPCPTTCNSFLPIDQITILAGALPKEHVRKYHLQTIGVHLGRSIPIADVTQFSLVALAIVETWGRASGNPEDPEFIKMLTALVDHVCESVSARSPI